MPRSPLDKLEAREVKSTSRILALMRRRILEVRGLVAAAKDCQQAANREKLFREIVAQYRALGGEVDAELRKCVTDVAMLSAKALGEAVLRAGKSLVKFSLERAKRYWQYIAPQNGASLAAVFTNRMSNDLVATLRRAVVEVEREASINGWTMAEIRKELEKRWGKLAQDDSNFKFVDRSGKAWDNRRYFEMLTRTTATRVYNDSFLDRMAENGFKYVKISQLGTEPDCDVCRAWNGVVCVISDKDDKFPTVAEAQAAGVFHPNCLCSYEYVDELLDKEAIEKQGNAGKVDWNDPDAVAGHRDGKSSDETAFDKAKSEFRGAQSDFEKAFEQLDEAGAKAAFTGMEGRVNDMTGHEGDSAGNRSFMEKAKDALSRAKTLVEQIPARVAIDREMKRLGVKRLPANRRSIVGTPPPANPKYLEGEAYQKNCTRCALAGYLRAVGYDVTAKPLPEKPDFFDPCQFWDVIWKNPKIVNIGIDKIEDEMKKFGEGSWAEIAVERSDRKGRHVFLAHLEDGMTKFTDPQTGTENYLSWKPVSNEMVAMCRIDTLEPQSAGDWIE